MGLENLKRKFEEIQDAIYFDEANHYREQTKKPEAVEMYIAELEEASKDGGEEPYFLLSVLGYCYRIINQPGKAIEVFRQCLVTVTDDDKKKMITLIRMGEAYKYNKQHDLALQLFEQAGNILHRGQFTEYVDFLYQHQAKCYFELNELDEAEELLEKALEIRKEKAAESLINSTRQVLAEVRRRRYGGHGGPDCN
ncbi:MAG: tetratricopeptide repeat protein [Lysinibacillus sp.]